MALPTLRGLFVFPRRHLALLFDTPDDGGAGAGSEVQAPVAETPDTPVNTPDTGTDGSAPGAPEIDWQDRYTHLQGAFTKTSQEAAEYRRVIEGLNSDDPETRSWAASQLGLELQPDEPVSPETERQQYAQLDPEVQKQLEAVLSREAEKQQQAQAESDYKAIREWADGQLNSIGVPAELHETVLAAAADMEPVWTANGQQLDLAGAWQHTLAFVEKFADIPQVRNSLLDSYQKTKQAPHVSPSGQPGVQVPDLTDRKARADFIETRFAAEQQHT